MKYPRFLLDSVAVALQDTPVLLLNGARQSGKSTLMLELIGQRKDIPYTTLDDLTALASAKADPMGFLTRFQSPTVIDEIQRCPELFLPIKLLVDQDRRPGRFLLTGSANVLLLPQLADSLSGRMEIFTLFPLSLGELAQKKGGLIDALLSKDPQIPRATSLYSVQEIMEQALRGGYPEVQLREAPDRRASWFQSYITTLLQRDVRDLAHIEDLTRLPFLMSLLAARSGSLLNLAELARTSGIPGASLNRYFTLLETLFLVHRIPAWSNNRSKKLVKSPKIYLNDTGVLCHLLKIDKPALETDGHIWGKVLETFVACELLKQASWHPLFPKLYHYRTATGQEVDFILEAPQGHIIGIEVKASSHVSAEDFKHLKSLAAEEGKKFRVGIVLYFGRETLPFGNHLYAVPFF